MKKKTFVTRAYVQSGNEQEYTLEYYITDDMNGECDYGIEISMWHSDIRESVSVDFPGSRNDILNLIEVYARNFVMPVSLHDLINDL